MGWKEGSDIKMYSESGGVWGETVESWREGLSELVQVMDETCLFWKALPQSGFGWKGNECKAGKKESFTNGDMEENPRCLKWFDKTIVKESSWTWNLFL